MEKQRICVIGGGLSGLITTIALNRLNLSVDLFANNFYDKMINKNFVCIVGGAGHIGTPLGLALSSKGYNVILIDKNRENVII